ncbi:amalgam-like 1, partial [Homarus americanus]
LSNGYSDHYNNYYYNNNNNFEDHNYYFDYDKSEEGDLPIFLSQPQSFTVEAGQSVTIPCDVENVVTSKLIFKKLPASGGREKLLAVGNERVTRDRRFSVDGSRLTISHARPRDAGTFLCMFEMDPPIQLTHTLDVQFAPTIRALAPPEQQVAKDTTVILQCKAQGNPEPIITWSRQEGPLPSGLPTEQASDIPLGKSLTLKGVDHHVEGTYLCTAHNGIGQPASAAMTIIVEYPPEITTEKVRGRPSPDVTWTRDGVPVPDANMDTRLHLPRHHNSSNNIHMSLSRAAHRHALTINNVSEKDFGAYVCTAWNTHGQRHALIHMTGLPETPKVTSSPSGGERTRYSFTWQTESYYPITEFLIKYRKTHLGAWHATNRTIVMAGSWENVSRKVATKTVKKGSPYFMTFTITGLEVATDYVAVIRVRNKYGWSAESPHFAFSTKRAMAVLSSESGARSHFPGSYTSVVVTSLTLFLIHI